MGENGKYIMVGIDTLEELFNEVKALRSEVQTLRQEPSKPFYNNNEMKEMLGVGEKLLKKYRDDGLLGFTHVGDKYWYRNEDINKFLESNHYDAYA